jgi:UDP-N-acetylglucosamine--N-acetylmuramyl-(pentapeptide) pyrophosphoryl-undecaprenol N-acetylglucosamine transferase
LHEIIYASDLVISLAGKSTIDESKAYGTPGIFIPIKNHFEQEDNASREGYSHQDVFRLESLISEKLESKREPLHVDGAEKASKIIRQFL